MVCSSPQALGLFRKRVLEAFNALVACMPVGANISGLSELVNSCTTLEAAQTIFDLAVQRSICYLETQGGSQSLTGLDTLLRAVIAALLACFSDVTAVSDIAAEVTVNSTLVELIDIYNRMVAAALCYLRDLFCIRPWPCDLIVNTVANESASLNIYDPFATGFILPNLVNCNQGLYFNTGLTGNTITPMGFMARVSLPLLTTVNGSLICTFHPKLVSFDAPQLTTVVGYLGVGSDATLGTINLPLLAAVGGGLDLNGNLNSTMDLPSLTAVTGNMDLSGTAVTTVDISALTSLAGNFKCQNAALTQSAVNAILVKLASLGSYTGRTVTLNLGSTPAPNGAGATAKAALIAAGNTVITN